MKKTFSLKWCASLILVLMLMCSCLFPTVMAEGAASTFTGYDGIEYKLVTTSEGVSLYADYESGLFVIVDAGGNTYYSVPEHVESDEKLLRRDKLTYASHLYIEYAFPEDFTISETTGNVKSKVNSVNKGLVKVKDIKDGIRVEFSFDFPEFFVPVEYTLKDGKLNASIIASEIDEGKEAKILTINLLPSFAGAGKTETGYIFVPDGSGALVDFNSNPTANTYQANVYGKELTIAKQFYDMDVLETVRMPVFGICRPGVSAVFGNIISGDAAAAIKAVVANSKCEQNSCSAVLNYRTATNDVYNSDNGRRTEMHRISEAKYSSKKFTVQYTFLDAANSDYTALAKEYQKYLVSKGMGKNDNAKLVNLDVYGALEVDANFMGIKYTKTKALTGYEDLITILEELKEDGINDPSFRYIGWQNDGIFNKSILTKNKLLGSMGGKSDWKKLQSYISENKIDASYDVDFLHFRKSLLTKSTSTAFNKKAWQYEYLRSTQVPSLTAQTWLLLKPDLIENNANKYLKSLNSSVENVSLSTLTNMIYSQFKEGEGMYRSEFPAIAAKVFENYIEKDKTIVGEAANGYALPYVTTVYNAPTTTSGHEMFSRNVMFYQIVLKGYVSTTSAPRQTELRADNEFLKAVETGSALLFNCIYENQDLIKGSRENALYSSRYDLWKDVAVEQYKEYSKLYKSLLGETIVANGELNRDVMMTAFSSGTTVIVNYNYEDAATDYGVVPARGFITVKGGAQ